VEILGAERGREKVFRDLPGERRKKEDRKSGGGIGNHLT